MTGGYLVPDQGVLHVFRKLEKPQAVGNGGTVFPELPREGERRLVHFDRIEGDVRVKLAGEFAWTSANRKMELSEGDQIKTSSSGSAAMVVVSASGAVTLSSLQPPRARIMTDTTRTSLRM